MAKQGGWAMAAMLIDFFFSYGGRIGRRAWWSGALAVTAAAVVGVVLFNGDSFDDSANASREALTMAAFLWLLLCLFGLMALCAKRLNDCGYPRLLILLGISGVILVCGRGAGLFGAILTLSNDTLAFWTLSALAAPSLAACAVLPSVERRS